MILWKNYTFILVQKVRSLNFNNDVLEAEEIVNDYTVKPAKKYTRTQKMATSTFEMKSIPTKLSGAWVQGPADELQKWCLSVFGFLGGERVCSFSLPPKKPKKT